jgi:hypothetical protein
MATQKKVRVVVHGSKVHRIRKKAGAGPSELASGTIVAEVSTSSERAKALAQHHESLVSRKPGWADVLVGACPTSKRTS